LTSKVIHKTRVSGSLGARKTIDVRFCSCHPLESTAKSFQIKMRITVDGMEKTITETREINALPISNEKNTV